jgi:hypothetical protein
MWRRLALILTASLALPAAARADEPKETSDDVRCLVVAFTLSQSQDTNAKQIGDAASAYYLGKLDGRTPGLDLEAELREAIPKVTSDTFMTQLQQCGAPLKTRFDEVKAIGDRLKAEFPTPTPPGSASPAPPASSAAPK